MKNYITLGALCCAVLVLGSCKSKESAYRAAYEKARAQEQTIVENNTPAVEPVKEVVTTPQVQENYDNVNVRSENVSLIDGTGLKAYSVVIGSFSIKTNALGVQSRMKSAGYDAQVVFNQSANNGNGMYRVVATTSNDKGEAVRSRDALRSQYPDAWLLFNK